MRPLRRAAISNRSVAWWVFVVIAIAASTLLARDVRRAVAVGGGGDLATVFAASRAWLHGQDPYDQQQLLREWDAAGGRKRAAPNPDRTPSVYPPSTFVVMAPVAALTWAQARVIWAVLDVAMVIAIVLALPALARVQWSDPRAMALAAGVIMLGPFRNGLRGGQLAVAVCALVVCSALAAQRRFDRTAGILLALACALKPPLAVPFVLGHALRRRWRIVTTAAGLAAVVMLAGIIRLQAAEVPWLPELRHNLLAAAAPGAANDASAWNPDRFQLINLHVLLHTMIESRDAVFVLVLVLTAVAAIAFARSAWRRGGGDDRGGDLAEVAFVAAWALLPFYHRWYDAGLLVLVLAWGVTALGTRQAPHARVAIVLVLTFAISPALWLTRALPHATSPPFRYSPGIEQLVLPVQVWALVLLCVVLLHVVYRDGVERRANLVGPDAVT
jgi:hypothetical protein